MLTDIWVSGTTVNTGPVCAHSMFNGSIRDTNDLLSLGLDSQVISALEAGSAETCCSLEVKYLLVSVCVCVRRIRQSHDVFVCVDVCENVCFHMCICIHVYAIGASKVNMLFSVIFVHTNISYW